MMEKQNGKPMRISERNWRRIREWKYKCDSKSFDEVLDVALNILESNKFNELFKTELINRNEKEEEVEAQVQ